MSIIGQTVTADAAGIISFAKELPVFRGSRHDSGLCFVPYLESSLRFGSTHKRSYHVLRELDKLAHDKCLLAQ